jgi:hypothetical protein
MLRIRGPGSKASILANHASDGRNWLAAKSQAKSVQHEHNLQLPDL